MLKRLKREIYVLFALSLCLALGSSPIYAAPQASSHYVFNESSIGAGGLNNSSSASYQGFDSLGSIGVGTSSSSNFQVASGSITPFDPALSVSINGTVNFATAFSAATPTTATTSFTVSNYTTYGYVAQIYGSTPSNGTTTIAAMGTTTPAASAIGTSQFGINLVANTSPISIGANLNNGQFGYGSVAANYNTSNVYRYVSGETIAQAAKNSGITTYTITYVVNVPALTPGGIYTSNQTLIVTGTY
ncbi:MAG: exported protein of unknown function [Candidatus Saccharibacteria bacterium]|nr:exported protein of unknown function [Candidatus Saccharibacteria bacterium]